MIVIIIIIIIIIIMIIIIIIIIIKFNNQLIGQSFKVWLPSESEVVAALLERFLVTNTRSYHYIIPGKW